jgi:hypothetical protein
MKKIDFKLKMEAVKMYNKRVILLALIMVSTVVIAHAQTVLEGPKQIGFSADYSLGYAAGIGTPKNNTANFLLTVGVKSKSFFAGIGYGIGYSNAVRLIEADLRLGSLTTPVYANVKINLNNKTISPFLSLSAGYTFDWARNIEVTATMTDGTVLKNNDGLSHPGFMLQPNFGIDFKIMKRRSLYLCFGLNMQQFEYFCLTPDFDRITSKSEMFKSIDIRLGIHLY